MTIHTVKNGDTLYGISQTYGVPVSRIEADNGITDVRNLVVGEDLIINEGGGLTVERGDSLFSIAQENGVTVNDLLKSNPSLNGVPLIYEGQTLYIDDVTGREIIVNGYAYPFITDENLRRVLPYLTYITVFTYGFREDGTLIVPNDTKIIETAKSYGVSPLLLLSTLTDEGVFNNNLSGKLFSDTVLQDTLIENLIDTALSKGYEGIEIDFEFIPKEDSLGYVDFLTKLKAKLENEGLPLFVALAPKTSDTQIGLLYEGHNYKAIGKVADYVILMTYEWGYQFGPPLAVAPIRNVEQVVNYAVSVIDKDKILLGIPNYAYDWPLPYVKGETEAKGISNVDALNTAIENGAAIIFDDDAKTPYFNYMTDGVEHVVWFENARSIEAKLDLVEKYGLAGISIWQVMRFFPQLYGVLKGKYDNDRN